MVTCVHMIKSRAAGTTMSLEKWKLRCCAVVCNEVWKMELVLASCCTELKPRPQKSLMRPRRSAAVRAGHRITDHNTEADLVSTAVPCGSCGQNAEHPSATTS